MNEDEESEVDYVPYELAGVYDYYYHESEYYVSY